MLILGLGMVGPFGPGVAAWESALDRGWQPPSQIGSGAIARLAYRVDFEQVPDKALLRKLRRADKFSKMTVLAAAEALADSGLDETARGRVGIILATALGPHVTTFEFLDGVLDYGEAAASPTAFSHSVHNAAVSYVTSSLAIQGPTLTVTRFAFAFQEALRLARCWLDQGYCDHVLVGMAEEYGTVLGYLADAKRGTAEDGRIRPFALAQARPVPGEGAAFFMLGRDGAKAYARIDRVDIGTAAQPAPAMDAILLEANGLVSESASLAALPAHTPVTSYTPLVGSLFTGSAFSLAAGALMLKRQRLFAAPVQENPHALPLVAVSGPAALKTIGSLEGDCRGRQAFISLTRP